MNYKVLLADDSSTIQKVIKITLANEPFDLIDCKNESELFAKLDSEKPTLVLLDFTLSEGKTGYELTKQILSKKPQTSVLMLFGTFDTVDEVALKNCGAKAKIIKPFDSTKFINLCRSLISEVEQGGQQIAFEKSVEPEIPAKIEVKDDSQWVVSAPKIVELQSSSTDKIPSALSSLESEVNDWGLAIPSKIDSSSGDEDLKLPPKIDSTTRNFEIVTEIQEIKLEIQSSGNGEETTLPASDDLEYPDIDAIRSQFSSIKLEDKPVEEKSTPKSKLVPLTELAPIPESAPVDEKTGEFQIVLDEGTTSEEDVRKLEEQISDEVEHAVVKKPAKVVEINIDENNLWGADEIERLNPTIKEAVAKIDEKLKGTTKTVAESISKSVVEEVKKDIVDLTIDSDFEARFKTLATPILESLVKEYCQKTLEKVAWEVIPDLAENLIKKEIERISQSVTEE
jgi:DNA-binding response OmpR family regulator